MYKYSVWCLSSVRWRPHAEQLKQWIARSATDPRQLSLARDYVHSVELSNTIETLADGFDLVEILHKIKYPVNSSATLETLEYIKVTLSELTPFHLNGIVENINANPSCFAFYRSLLHSDVFVKEAIKILPTMSNVEVTRFGQMYWFPRKENQSEHNSSMSSMTSFISKLLGERLQYDEEKLPVMQLSIEYSIPLHLEEMQFLRNEILSVTSSYLDSESLQMILRLLSGPQVPRIYEWWGDAIQVACFRKQYIDDENAIFVAMSFLRIGVCPADFLCMRVTVCAQKAPVEEMLLAVHILFNSGSQFDRFEQSLIEVRESISIRVRKECVKMSSLPISELSFQWLLCLSKVSIADARQTLESILLEHGPLGSYTPRTVVLACKVMVSLNSYPPALLGLLSKTSDARDLGQEDCIILLYVMEKSGISTTEELLKKAIGKAATRLRSTRNPISNLSIEVSSDALVLLLAGLSFKNRKEEVDIIDRVLMHFEVSPEKSVTILQHLIDVDTLCSKHLKETLLKGLLRQTDSLSTEELGLVIQTFSQIGKRDAVVFERLIESLKKKDPQPSNILLVAQVARRLKFVPLFERSNIVSFFAGVSNINESDLLSILGCCNQDQQLSLMGIRGVREMLSQVDVRQAKTPDLLLLFSLNASNRDTQNIIISELETRKQLRESDILLGDVTNAFEATTRTEDLGVLCRVLANPLLQCGEVQLMRLLRCVGRYQNCPKVFFRVVGRAVLSCATCEKLTADNSLLWLKFYVHHRVRDDSVGKALIRRASDPAANFSLLTQKEFQKAALFFGVPLAKRATKRKKWGGLGNTETQNF